MEKYYSLFKKYFFWYLLFLLVFIPAYPKFPLINVKGTFVAIRIEDILIALGLLFWLIANLYKLRSYSKQTIFQAFLLFWLIGGLSVVSGRLITHSLSVNLGLLNWLRRVETMSLFLVAATTIKSQKQLKILIMVMLVTTVLIVLYGFGQIWLQFPTVSTNNSEFSKGLILYLNNGARVNSTFGGHYDLAAYLSMFLVILASLFFYYKSIKEKFLMGLTGLVSFALLGLTTARVSYVAAILGLILSFLLNGKKLFIIIVLIVSIATIGLVPDLRHRLVATITVNVLNGGGPKYAPPPGTFNIFTPSNQLTDAQRQILATQQLQNATKSGSVSALPIDVAPGEPVNTTELGVERSFDIRTNVEWPRALHGFAENPFLGTGYSSLTVATDNDYLRSLGETGILGTLSLILVFYVIVKRFMGFIKAENSYGRLFVIGLICSVFAVLITGTFIDILEASKVAEVLWIILGVGWAVSRNYEEI